MRSWIRFGAGALGLLLSGCAIVAPRLGPDPDIDALYAAAPTLPNAIAVAESLRSKYAKKVEHQIITERITGLALIGAAAVAADLSLRSVGKSEILGLGLGAAAVYTGTSFLVGKPQELIYAAGATAVQCSLDAIHPLRVAYASRDELQQLIDEIPTQLQDLAVKLVRFEGVRTALVLRGQSLVEEAGNVLPVAREALVVLDSAGGELRSSIAAIQGQITTAVITNSPSLEGLLESLGKSLPSLGARITGVALPATANGTPVRTSGNDDAIEAALLEPIHTLEKSLAKLKRITSAVQAKPNFERLKACSVDLTQSGLTMKVTPTEALSIAAGTAGNVSVTGGVLPYRQGAWIGTAPPADQVEIVTETGAGLITVRTKPTAPPGTYLLLVRDQAQGREMVNIAITAPVSKSGAGGTAGDRTSTACRKDPEVEVMQKKLIETGIQTVEVAGQTKELKPDGCLGDITDAAMRQFYKSQGIGITDDAVPKERDALFKAVLDLLKDSA